MVISVRVEGDEGDRRRILSERKKEMERRRMEARESRAGIISMRLDIRAQLSPACDRSRLKDRFVLAVLACNSLCIGQCTCDFCEVNKENRAARVACNQSHVIRARCIVLRSAARGYAPSIVNIARGHSCDVQRPVLVHFSPLAPCIVKENSSLLYPKAYIGPPRTNLVQQ